MAHVFRVFRNRRGSETKIVFVRHSTYSTVATRQSSLFFFKNTVSPDGIISSRYVVVRTLFMYRCALPARKI